MAIATWDDPTVTFDDPLCTWDGTVTVVASTSLAGSESHPLPRRIVLTESARAWIKKKYNLEPKILPPETVVVVEEKPPKPPSVSFSVRARLPIKASGGIGTTFLPPSVIFSVQATLPITYSGGRGTNNAERIARRRREEAALLLGIVE